MPVLRNLIESVKRRRMAAQAARETAEQEARVLLSRVSYRQALHELRERQARERDAPEVRRRLEAIRNALFRLSTDHRRADTATRMHYRDLR